MKTQMFILIVMVSILVGNVQGILIWDSGDHVFSEGSEDFIYMYNDATAEISGGEIGCFEMNDESIATVIGGNILYELWANETSTLNFLDGSIYWIKTFNLSSVNIGGGNLDSLFAEDDSSITISGGAIGNRLVAYEWSIIDIYGYGFNYNISAGAWDGGQLTGFWEDGTPFSIDFDNWNRENGIAFEHVNLHVIPEPASLVLFTFISFLIATRQHKS